MTLHFSQIGFTDDLTFMVNPPFHEKATFKKLKVEKKRPSDSISQGFH